MTPQICILTALCVMFVMFGSHAHAELAIWQVENNPPGQDSGNEWLTLINTGNNDTFDNYKIQTTNGRIASYFLPTKTLDTCESYKIILPKQSIDNEDDTVKLLKDGMTIYETPVIKDTKNDDRFWTNPDVTAICGDAPPTPPAQPPSQPPPTTTTDPTIIELEERIIVLEERIIALEQMVLRVLELLNDLLGEN